MRVANTSLGGYFPIGFKQDAWKHAHNPRRDAGRTRTYLRAGPCAIHDSVTAVEGERVLKLCQAFLRVVIPGVNHPAIGLKVSGI